MAELADTSLGPFIESPADPLVEEAWEAPSRAERLVLARRALDVDPDCLDAHSLLAALADNPAPHLRAAVEIGERLWAPVFDEPLMNWARMAGTRPWMRAMLDLAAIAPEEEALRLRARLRVLDPEGILGGE